MLQLYVQIFKVLKITHFPFKSKTMTIDDDMHQDAPETFIRDIRSGELHFRKRIPVSILGATSALGQKLACLLSKHPWFELIHLTGPDELVQRSYGSVVHWHQHEPIPEKIANLPLVPNTPEHIGSHLVFSTLEGEDSKTCEEHFAKSGFVVLSCAASYVGTPSIPLIIPEANLEHIELIKKQTYSERGKLIGFAGIPASGLAIALRPLALEFGIEAVQSVCLQTSLSSFASYEEERFLQEVERVIFNPNDGGPIRFCLTCVQATIGEECKQAVSVKLQNPAKIASLRLAWKEFSSPISESYSPTAPTDIITYVEDKGFGSHKTNTLPESDMTVFTGQLKDSPILDFKFLISYNSLMRGCLGNALLTAEYLVRQGMIFW
jgi:aspartate-semialdehyde dehydrogenase